LWQIRDGKPQPPITIIDDGRPPTGVSFSRTPLGLAFSYTRPDDATAKILRVFQLPLLLQLPKTRSARH
jgi:hypothetical protein